MPVDDDLAGRLRDFGTVGLSASARQPKLFHFLHRGAHRYAPTVARAIGPPEESGSTKQEQSWSLRRVTVE